MVLVLEKVIKYMLFSNNNCFIYPKLSRNISINEEKIVDNSTHLELKSNMTGCKILELCTGNICIEDIISSLKSSFAVDEDILEKETIDFLHMLNSNRLVNYNLRLKNNLFVNVKCFLKLFKTQRRYDVIGFNILGLIKQLIIITFSRFWIYLLMPNLFILIVLLVSILTSNYVHFMIELFMFLNVLFWGAFSSIALHESIHVYIYRKHIKEELGYIAKNGLSLAFFKPNYDKSISLKLLGGLLTGILGIIGLIIMDFFNINDFKLLIFFFMYAIHLFNLLPFWGDGKAILILLINRLFKSKK